MFDAGNGLSFPVTELPADAASPESAVRFLVAELVRVGRLPAQHAGRVACQVLHREALGSTALGRGVALPHSKSDVVEELLGVVGRCPQPLPWPGAQDGQPVRFICLLVTATSQPGAALRALEAVVRRLRQEPG